MSGYDDPYDGYDADYWDTARKSGRMVAEQMWQLKEARRERQIEPAHICPSHIEDIEKFVERVRAKCRKAQHVLHIKRVDHFIDPPTETPCGDCLNAELASMRTKDGK